DGRRLLVLGSEPGKGSRIYVVDSSGGKARPLTPEGVTGGAALSPDGQRVVFNDAEHRAVIYPVDGGQPQPIPGLSPGDMPIQWSADGGSLYVTREGEIPATIYRYSLSDGRKTLWKE